ncbi:MAG: peptidyl-prolyl cis-trans isomerase [Candidatus Dependentiae bacterium]|jgi:parvulin-like peptidyl-prolyl isomerase
MKKLLLLSLAMTPLMARELVDKVVARVNNANILHSTLQTPQISKDGKPFTLDEAIVEELWVQRANERKVMPTELDIDKQIIAVKQDQGVLDKSDEEADASLEKAIGINFATYRHQLMRFHAMEMMKGQEVRSRCSVSNHEVREYYDKHPEKVTARYRISLATLTPNEVKQWRTLKKTPSKVLWEALEWMEATDIGAHLSRVFNMKKGEVSDVIKTKDGSLAVRVDDIIEARTKTLEECYGKIENHLRRDKIDDFAAGMEKELRDGAVIVKL